MSERHWRSIVKGATWRTIGTMDTLLLSWLFTGRVDLAAAIGGIEVFTKILLFYLHERIWLKVSWARAHSQPRHTGPHDRRHRSLVKGISWRITGTTDTILIAWIVTGNAFQAIGIGFTEVVTKVFLYYLHERAWQRVRHGRLAAPPGAGSEA